MSTLLIPATATFSTAFGDLVAELKQDPIFIAMAVTLAEYQLEDGKSAQLQLHLTCDEDDFTAQAVSSPTQSVETELQRAERQRDALLDTLIEIADIKDPGRLALDPQSKVGDPNGCGYGFQILARQAIAAVKGGA